MTFASTVSTASCPGISSQKTGAPRAALSVSSWLASISTDSADWASEAAKPGRFRPGGPILRKGVTPAPCSRVPVRMRSFSASQPSRRGKRNSKVARPMFSVPAAAKPQSRSWT
jgi:hypothetical protein